MLDKLSLALVEQLKHKAVNSELKLLAGLFGLIASIFFAMAGWHFIQQFKGNIFASLVVGAVFIGLAAACLIVAHVKSKQRHRDLFSHFKTPNNQSSTADINGSNLVNAFLGGLEMGLGKTDNPSKK